MLDSSSFPLEDIHSECKKLGSIRIICMIVFNSVKLLQPNHSYYCLFKECKAMTKYVSGEHDDLDEKVISSNKPWGMYLHSALG